MNFAIITEYNPFHNGHKYQIDKIKENYPNSNIIIIMSGNFVQRGDVAIASKFVRTEMALNSGADLVLEIPQIFATSSANYFAKGSISILDRLNIIDNLCFGTENTDIDALKDISMFLIDEPIEYKEKLSIYLKEGHSYPKSRELALSNYGFSNTLNTPNNILGVEYIKSLIELKSKIKPIAINRTNDYHEKNIINEISSATSIRENISNIELIKKTIPINCFDIFEKEINSNNYDINNLSSIFSYIFSTKSKEELLGIIDMTEHLYNRFKQTLTENYYINDIVKSMSSKNYTNTRIRRIIINTILDNKQKDLEYYTENGASFVRLLGFNKQKQNLLSELIEKADINIVTNIKNANKILNEQEINLLYKDIDKTNVFLISNSNKTIALNNNDFENKIIIKRNFI